MGKVLLAYPILNFRLAHPLILIDIGGLNDLRELFSYDIENVRLRRALLK